MAVSGALEQGLLLFKLLGNLHAPPGPSQPDMPLVGIPLRAVWQLLTVSVAIIAPGTARAAWSLAELPCMICLGATAQSHQLDASREWLLNYNSTLQLTA